MATEPGGPFREKSLERLSSPERLDQLLAVVDPRSWLPLVALGLLLFALLLWSVLGSIPINVEGKGILVRPRGVVELHSPGAGYLANWDIQVGRQVEAGELLGAIARPDLVQQIELLRVKAEQLTALSRASEILDLENTEQPTGDAGFEGESRAGHIRASRALAADLRDRGLGLIREERKSLDEQLELARGIGASVKKRLAKQTEMFDERLASEQDVLAAEQDSMDSLERISRLEASLRALHTRELELEDQYYNRLQRIADWRLDLQGYEQQVADVQREIARLELQLERESRIVSEKSGRILEIGVEAGQFLHPGDRLGTIAIGSQSSPLTSLAYFTIKDGMRITSADPIRVTPDSVERQRFGSILGTVGSISAYPVTLAEAKSMIGNEGLAEALMSGGYRMEVLAELKRDPETPSGFEWSSSGGPDMRFAAGTTTAARVAIDSRPPITFVLPFLKRAFGIE